MFEGVSLKLVLLEGHYVVCRLGAGAIVPPPGLDEEELYSVTMAPGETSVVCLSRRVPPCVAVEDGWRLLRVDGKLDFALTGILASLAVPLAEKGISAFALSTFDTDYLLVKDSSLGDALIAWRQAGHTI